MMEGKKGYRAIAKNLPMSPTKIRPIANTIRRRPYPEAVTILENLPNKGARFLKKVIESAAANAMSQDNMLDEESLFVEELLVDAGPTQKRMWPRGKGRADRLLKRSSHISVVLGKKGRGE